jgi:hypothetical protein
MSSKLFVMLTPQKLYLISNPVSQLPYLRSDIRYPGAGTYWQKESFSKLHFRLLKIGNLPMTSFSI